MTFIIAILAGVIGEIFIERHRRKAGVKSIPVPVLKDDHLVYRKNDKYRR